MNKNSCLLQKMLTSDCESYYICWHKKDTVYSFVFFFTVNFGPTSILVLALVIGQLHNALL